MSDAKNPMGKMFEKGETPEFAGKAIVGLAKDKAVIKKTGRYRYQRKICPNKLHIVNNLVRIIQTIDLAREYDFQEDDGRLPMDMRSGAIINSFSTSHDALGLLPSSLHLASFSL